MKDIIQTFLALPTANMMIIAVCMASYIWHIRNPPEAKRSSNPNSITNNTHNATSPERSMNNLAMLAYILGLIGVWLVGLGPAAKQSLTTSDAASLLLSFMLFLSGYMFMVLRR